RRPVAAPRVAGPRPQRQVEAEHAAAARRRIVPDAAAVVAHDLARDGEAEAGAARLPGGSRHALREAGEEPAAELRVDAGAVVADAGLCMARAAGDGQRHGLAGR